MSFNNSNAVRVEQNYSNVLPLVVVDGKIKKKEEHKYKKDGTIKQTKNNKVSGKSSEVYAFNTKEKINTMLNVFDKHIEESTGIQRQIACRNKLLFLIGINIGIRASDLRELKWSFFFDRQNDGSLRFKTFYVLQPKKQRKQKKFVKLFFNQTIQTAINNYINEYPIKNMEDYLFWSREGDEPITIQNLWDIIKKTAKKAGIEENIGSHSLRKTWGFWCFHEAKDKDKALVILQQCFNHSSTQVTMRYIGLMDEEISDMYNSIELGLEMI